jgi:hypothetical protein
LTLSDRSAAREWPLPQHAARVGGEQHHAPEVGRDELGVAGRDDGAVEPGRKDGGLAVARDNGGPPESPGLGLDGIDAAAGRSGIDHPVGRRLVGEIEAGSVAVGWIEPPAQRPGPSAEAQQVVVADDNHLAETTTVARCLVAASLVGRRHRLAGRSIHGNTSCLRQEYAVD